MQYYAIIYDIIYDICELTKIGASHDFPPPRAFLSLRAEVMVPGGWGGAVRRP